MKKDATIYLLLGLNLLLCSAIVALLVISMGRQSTQTGTPPGQYVDLANALEARGLHRAALGELENYRRAAGLDNDEEANLLYRMGKIADDELGDCQTALPYYTMADSLVPDASWSKEAGRRTVVCMEKIGKKRESRALLNRLTGGAIAATPDADDPAAKDPGPVVAVIDGRSVTWAEVEAAMKHKHKSEVPAEIDERLKMLQEYVVTTLMYEDAIKKGYDRDRAAKDMAGWAAKEALARYYFHSEIGGPDNEQAAKKLLEKLALVREVRIFNEAVPAP